jgi:acyl-CoA thioesterase YciA
MADESPNVSRGPHMRTIAMPRDANASGAIFGGWTASQIDLAGATFVAQRARGRIVTGSIEAMRFLRPISVGNAVSCHCTPEHEGDSSVAVKIDTWAGDRSGA